MTNQRGMEGAPSTYCRHALGQVSDESEGYGGAPSTCCRHALGQVSDESEGYGGCSFNLLSTCAGAGN